MQNPSNMSFNSSYDSISNFSSINFYNDLDNSNSSKTTSSYLATENELRNSLTDSAKNVFNLMDSILFDQVENTQFKSLEEECSNWKQHFPHLRITGQNYIQLTLDDPDRGGMEEVDEVIAIDGLITTEDCHVAVEEYLRCDPLSSAQLEAEITAGLCQNLAWKVCELIKPFLLKAGKRIMDRRHLPSDPTSRLTQTYRITNIVHINGILQPSTRTIGAEQLDHLKNCLKVTSKAIHSTAKETTPSAVPPLSQFASFHSKAGPSVKYSRFMPSRNSRLEPLPLQSGVVGKRIDPTGDKGKSPEVEDDLSAPSAKQEPTNQILFTIKKKNLNFERITSAMDWKSPKKTDIVRKTSKRPQTTFPILKLNKSLRSLNVDSLLRITSSDKNMRLEKVETSK